MSADSTHTRRGRRSNGPGPFDPGAEFAYDPSRGREGEDGDGLEPGAVGPGPFDPGPDVRYDPSRGRDPDADADAEVSESPPPPPPELEIPGPEIDPGPAVVPEPEPPREPEPEPPAIPEPIPPSEPEPERPAALEPEPPPAVDTLDPAPWVPEAPPPPPRRRPPQPPRRPRAAAAGKDGSAPRRRPWLRAAAALAVLSTVAAGLAWAVGADLPAPLGSAADSGGANVAAAGAGAAVPGREVRQEDPSSLAITSDAGPFHPVAFEGEVDYGEAGAKFGADRYGRSHEGQDMFAKEGTPLVAVRDGVVVERGNDGGRGNYIGIYSPDTEQTYVYLHMVKPTWLKPGDGVIAGQQVGGMGCTGSCYGTHLHFEIRRGEDIEAKPIDPLPSLKQWPQAPPLEPERSEKK